MYFSDQLWDLDGDGNIPVQASLRIESPYKIIQGENPSTTHAWNVDGYDGLFAKLTYDNNTLEARVSGGRIQIGTSSNSPLDLLLNDLPFLSVEVNGRVTLPQLSYTPLSSIVRTVNSKVIEYVSITDWGAIGDGSQANKTINRVALTAALAYAASSTRYKGVYVPDGVFVIDGYLMLTSVHNGITLFGNGPSSCIKLANVPDPSSAENAWMLMLKDQVTTMSNIRITGLKLDGNKDSIVWGTSGHNIIAYQDSYIQNCQADNLWLTGAITNGAQVYVGGLRLVDIHANFNGMHGVGISVSTTFRDEFAEVYNLTAEDNGGYGIDFSKGRTIADNIVCKRNTFGGAKTSTGALLVQLGKMICEDNPSVGFQNTGNAPDLEFYADCIICKGNANAGFRMGTGKHLRINSIICSGNQTVTVVGADVIIGVAGEGLTSADIGYIQVDDSPSSGILVDGEMLDYTFHKIKVTGCENYAFRDSSNGATNGRVLSGYLRNNNQAAAAGFAGAVYLVETPGGTHRATNITFEDTQGVPTQVSGMLFTNTVQGFVDECVFGTGISSTLSVGVNTAGTLVKFGRNNSGIVTYVRGTYVGNGGFVNHNAVFATPFAVLSNQEFVVKNVQPTSAAAAIDHYVDWAVAAGTQRTQIDVVFPAGTTVGVNNVSYTYEVEMQLRL